MSFHRFFVNLAWLVFVASVIGLLVLISTVAPDTFRNILLFYAATLGMALSFFTLSGFYLRRLFGSREHSERYLVLSSRQGLWLSLILIISLLLSSHELFSWVNAVFLSLVFIFLESYLLTKNPKNE